MIDFAPLPSAALARMSSAADTLLETLDESQAAGRHILDDLIDPTQGFHARAHYPDDDASDTTSGAHYYYHAHWDEARAQDEHGHFHCFIHTRHMRRKAKPLKVPNARMPRLSHLVSLSIAPTGLPLRLFAVNHWVTDDYIFPAGTMNAVLGDFTLADANGPPRVNTWLESIVTLFSPQISALIEARDSAWAQYAGAHPDTNRYSARELEVTSSCPIDIDDQIARLDAALVQQLA